MKLVLLDQISKYWQENLKFLPLEHKESLCKDQQIIHILINGIHILINTIHILDKKL